MTLEAVPPKPVGGPVSASAQAVSTVAVMSILTTLTKQVFDLDLKISAMEKLMATLDPAVVALQAANTQLSTDVANLLAAINLLLPSISNIANQAANDAAISAVTQSTTALDAQVTASIASITAAQASTASTASVSG